MNYRLFKYSVVLLLFVCCANKPKENLSKKEFLAQEEGDIPIGYQNLYLKGEIKKEEDYKKENKYGCPDWILKKEQLHNILAKMKRVEPNEWYAICYNYPCWYKGVVQSEVVEYEITINSASYIILSNEDETLHFVMENESELFLVPCNCCE